MVLAVTLQGLIVLLNFLPETERLLHNFVIGTEGERYAWEPAVDVYIAGCDMINREAIELRLLLSYVPLLLTNISR